MIGWSDFIKFPSETYSLLGLPHTTAKSIVATGAPVYVLVNPDEYHGPHLSLGNDALISAGLVRDLHPRLRERHPNWPLLLGPSLAVGVGPTPGPGSRPTPYRVVRRLVIDTCRALCDLGAQRIILMTFHGSPLHNLALEAGVRYCQTRGVQALAPLHLILREMMALEVGDPSLEPRFGAAVAHVQDLDERRRLIDELPLDYHAGFFETSLALHYAPQSVSPTYQEVPPCPARVPSPGFDGLSTVIRKLWGRGLAREVKYLAWGKAWIELSPFPGYTGAPARATAEAGAIFAGEIIETFSRCALDLFEGRRTPPLPVMRWVGLPILSMLMERAGPQARGE